MSSVKCGQCGLVNWGAEEKCKRCDSSLANAPSSSSSPITSRSKSKSVSTSASCPQCHSEETRSFEMVYSSGTSKGSVTAFSFDIDSGTAMSTGGAVSQQSNLAASVAPPLPPPMNANQIVLKGALAILAALIIVPPAWWLLPSILPREAVDTISVMLAVMILIAGVVWGLVIESNRHQEVLKKFERGALADWKQSWICLRCGFRWKK